MATLRNADMPAPEVLVDYGAGVVAAAMLHYAGEDARADQIASDNGFESQFLLLEDHMDVATLGPRQEAGDNVLPDWHPTPPDGWMLGAKYDTESGPVAMFIRKKD